MDAAFKLVLDHLPVGVVFTDPEGRIVYCNAAEARIRGSQANLLIGQSVLDCHSTPSRTQVEDLVASFRNGHNRGFTRMNDRDAKFIEQWFSPVVDPRGAYLGMLLVSVDLTTLESSRRKLEALATRDELTGLFNKNHYTTAFAAMRRQLCQEIASLALLMVDVNGLKEINDFLGHEAGDKVISGTAAIIKRSIRVSDSAFRFGGDEFVVLMPGADESGAKAACRRIKAACRRWTDEHPDLPISVGTGWAVATTLEEGETLFEKADEAMYRDKRREKERLRARSSAV
jgi:diguanylate cyclase (GGDEF)-like protein/PAS domain S-box-containing protein